MNNPIANTQEYKQYYNQFRTNLLKYQPRVKWYFKNIEKGIGFNDIITLEEMKRMAESVSPIGPKVPINEIEDITPSYNELCDKFHSKFGYSYSDYQKWISQQKDVFYYSREKVDFSVNEGYRIASELGYRKVIMENLS
jgi:hypothetical protein